MQKPRFIKNDEGLYRVRGYVSPDELVEIAADVLLEKLVAQESLTSPQRGCPLRATVPTSRSGAYRAALSSVALVQALPGRTGGMLYEVTGN